jgi:trimethylamine--corrinoid protein Co-methyltransferase
MEIFSDSGQVTVSTELLGKATVDMLARVHLDALWILENIGVGCGHPDILDIFSRFEGEGKAVVHDGRIYITADLVTESLRTVPSARDFAIARGGFFIGGRAAFVYNDMTGRGDILPTLDHARRIAEIAERSAVVAGMGGGVMLKDELSQINVIAEHCSKPLALPVSGDGCLPRLKELHEQRGRVIMAVFCLTRHPLRVNENFADSFVETVRAGVPVFASAIPMAGISAPYCSSGVLAITHAEALFAICAAQLLNPGVICVHAGIPSIADPRFNYSPNYGLVSHNLLNVLMAHLNMMLDLPTCQSGCTTNEQNVTPRALADARAGMALFRKYGFHMVRHAFGFLRNMIDFSFAKLERVIESAETVTPAEAPGVEMPVYDERGMESIQRYGLSMYKDDPLTTANIGKVFVD